MNRYRLPFSATVDYECTITFASVSNCYVFRIKFAFLFSGEPRGRNLYKTLSKRIWLIGKVIIWNVNKRCKTFTFKGSLQMEVIKMRISMTTTVTIRREALKRISDEQDWKKGVQEKRTVKLHLHAGKFSSRSERKGKFLLFVSSRPELITFIAKRRMCIRKNFLSEENFPAV